MPMPIDLAHQLARKLAEVRKANGLPWLRPDGKSQVTIEYAYGRPKRVDTVLVSTQHAPGVSQTEIRKGVTEHIIMPVLPSGTRRQGSQDLRQPDRLLRGGRPAGRLGHDRAQDHRRHLRRHGPSRRRLLQRQGSDEGRPFRRLRRRAGWPSTSLPPGWPTAARSRWRTPSAWRIRCRSTSRPSAPGKLPDDEIIRLINELFDLRPGAIIRDLHLRRPIYQQVAAYGHFGRTDLDLPWEKLTRLERAEEGGRRQVGRRSRLYPPTESGGGLHRSPPLLFHR